MIVILDFGSQYNQLIARKVRAQNIPAQIVPFNTPIEQIRELKPEGLILSGGPASVHEEGSPQLNLDVLELGVPILGICYGMQALAHATRGRVQSAERREYGLAKIVKTQDDPLLKGILTGDQVWMSHGDSVADLPEDWFSLARTENTNNAIIRHSEKPWWGLQFHPEVHHTV